MASSIPAAVNSLISIATAALPTDAYIWFGKELGVYTAPITLQIIGVVGDQVPAELGPDYRREETYEIQCRLSSFAGDQDFVSRLSEVMTQFQALEVAIANNPTLNGAVRFAQVGGMDFTPDADGKGMSVGELDFVVRCEARITSLS